MLVVAFVGCMFSAEKTSPPAFLLFEPGRGGAGCASRPKEYPSAATPTVLVAQSCINRFGQPLHVQHEMEQLRSRNVKTNSFILQHGVMAVQ